MSCLNEPAAVGANCTDNCTWPGAKGYEPPPAVMLNGDDGAIIATFASIVPVFFIVIDFVAIAFTVPNPIDFDETVTCANRALALAASESDACCASAPVAIVSAPTASKDAARVYNLFI